MKRREILKYTMFATGAAISAPILMSLSSCKPDTFIKKSDYKTVFFDDNQYNTIQALVDYILPKSDSPSATDVGVHQMIDNMVGNVYELDDRAKYKEAFAQLEMQLNKDLAFAKLKQADQEKKIADLEGVALTSYREVKQQTIAYYLNTEEIGKNYLNYLPVPGEYEGCITLESVGGKKWAI